MKDGLVACGPFTARVTCVLIQPLCDVRLKMLPLTSDYLDRGRGRDFDPKKRDDFQLKGMPSSKLTGKRSLVLLLSGYVVVLRTALESLDAKELRRTGVSYKGLYFIRSYLNVIFI